MSSRKEEERIEKIIRGLMKLPPNRRCINCNSLGPQYVCTTFWSFVCITCSGIHREFTHRVKSVSMAKFTSQEVEALQNGGNQRAREIYLKGWDPQTQRFPDNSNAEKIRQFIKNAYVDKKYYAPQSSDKPPKPVQNSRNLEDTRRASSYHSYSQSPPYDFQYEERRYGKHAPALTRKPGSDRGSYEGKFSSSLSSSGSTDPSFEDIFSTEGSHPSISDFSASSGVQSPNYQKDVWSPFSETVRDVSTEDPQYYTGKYGASTLHPQRTAPAGSRGSLDSLSFKSVSSVEVVEVAPESERSLKTHDKEFSTSPSLPHPSISETSHVLNLFTAPSGPQTFTPVASFASSLDLLSEMPPKLPAATVDGNSQVKVIPPNEGWATFDSQTVVSAVGNASNASSLVSSSKGNSTGNFDPSPLVRWSSFEEPASDKRPSVPSLGQDVPRIVQSISNPVSSQWPSLTDFSARGDSPASNKMETQSWTAFEDSPGQLNSQSTQTNNLQLETQDPLVVDHHKEFRLSEAATYADRKPTNPFDLPYDSSLESNNMSQFWNISSLQAALPDARMPTSLIADNLTQSWYNQGPAAPYVPSGPQGAWGFMAAQAQSAQIPNVHVHGPVASIGGNPFA